jgi:hypothetical protein
MCWNGNQEFKGLIDLSVCSFQATQVASMKQSFIQGNLSLGHVVVISRSIWEKLIQLLDRSLEIQLHKLPESSVERRSIVHVLATGAKNELRTP